MVVLRGCQQLCNVTKYASIFTVNDVTDIGDQLKTDGQTIVNG